MYSRLLRTCRLPGRLGESGVNRDSSISRGVFPGVAPCHNGAIASVGVSRRALPPFSPGGQNGRLVSMSGPYGPWRRWRDSNSRRLFASPVFKTGAFDHSTTSAYGAALRTAYEPDVQTANFLYGPSGETRTPDPMLPKHVRYQLRYTRIFLLGRRLCRPSFSDILHQYRLKLLEYFAG